MVQSGWNSWNVVPKRFWLELLRSEFGVGRPQQMPGPFKRPTASDGPSDRRKSGRCPLDLAASTATSQSKFLPSTEPVRMRRPVRRRGGFLSRSGVVVFDVAAMTVLMVRRRLLLHGNLPVRIVGFNVWENVISADWFVVCLWRCCCFLIW